MTATDRLVVVAGESLIDRIVRPDGSARDVPGGGPFNVARTLGRLGAHAAFLGGISTDRLGRRLRAALAADGVGLSLAATTDQPTLIATAVVDATGVASYRFAPADNAAASLSNKDVAGGLPDGTAALSVGTLGFVLEPMATTIVELTLAAGPDVLVMADPNVRPAAIPDRDAYRSRLNRLLGRVDVVKVSTDDLAWLEPERDVIEGARRLLASGPRLALITDGGRPVRIVTADDVTEIPVPAVTVVDTIGAGDAFVGGFLAAWLGAGRGRGALGDASAVDAATRFAVEVGARTTTRPGADPPTISELREVRIHW